MNGAYIIQLLIIDSQTTNHSFYVPELPEFKLSKKRDKTKHAAPNMIFSNKTRIPVAYKLIFLHQVNRIFTVIIYFISRIYLQQEEYELNARRNSGKSKDEIFQNDDYWNTQQYFRSVLFVSKGRF